MPVFNLSHLSKILCPALAISYFLVIIRVVVKPLPRPFQIDSCSRECFECSICYILTDLMCLSPSSTIIMQILFWFKNHNIDSFIELGTVSCSNISFITNKEWIVLIKIFFCDFDFIGKSIIFQRNIIKLLNIASSSQKI